jgi:hypothetical protein
MMYDNNDNHPTVKILKKKGWVLFEIYSSSVKDEWGGWWIDTAIAFKTEHMESHKEINCKFLGCTLKDALYTLRQDDFPINGVR